MPFINGYRAIQVTAGSISPTAFPSSGGGDAYIQADPANLGSVTIGGLNGTTPDGLGIVLAAGATLAFPLPVANLSQLSYTTVVGAKINVLLGS